MTNSDMQTLNTAIINELDVDLYMMQMEADQQECDADDQEGREEYEEDQWA